MFAMIIFKREMSTVDLLLFPRRMVMMLILMMVMLLLLLLLSLELLLLMLVLLLLLLLLLLLMMFSTWRFVTGGRRSLFGRGHQCSQRYRSVFSDG